MQNRLFSHNPAQPTEADIATNAALSECGDVLGEMFHPAFRELAFWAQNQVLAFVPYEGMAHA